MILRPVKAEDWEEIVTLAKNNNQGFPIPSPGMALSMWCIERDSKIIAFGCLLKYVESMFLPDLSLSKRDTIEALKLMNDKSIEVAKELGISQLNSSIKDESFYDILIKHFGYLPSTGSPLYFNVEE